MVRYLVETFDSKAFFNTLKEARAYAYRHTPYVDTRSYIYTGPDADDRLVGTVFMYGGILYWKGRITGFLFRDGSVKELAPKRLNKKQPRTNEFGLDLNLR